jgi:hypothetical protein
MDIVASLRRAAKYYGGLVIAGPLLLFATVEGWRSLVYLGSISRAGGSAGLGSVADLSMAILYVAVAILYLRREQAVGLRGGRTHLVASVLYLLLGTVALYGSLEIGSNFLPDSSGLPDLPRAGHAILGVLRRDILAETCLTASVFLAVYLLRHRKIRD